MSLLGKIRNAVFGIEPTPGADRDGPPAASLPPGPEEPPIRENFVPDEVLGISTGGGCGC